VEGVSGPESMPWWCAAGGRGPGTAGRSRVRPVEERGATGGVIEHGTRLAQGRQSPRELPFGGLRVTERPLWGEVAMVETGDAAPTASSLEVGDAGNGYPAPAWKALGSSQCVSTG
jgi:hypothetical protein